MERADGEITRLAMQWGEGNEEAFDRLIELVYDDLRAIAHHHLARGARDRAVDTTMLVHEAYLKLVRVEGGSWPGRTHFFAFCSKVMRHILIDFARRARASKRGGGRIFVPLSQATAVVESDLTDVLAVEEALQRLEERNPRMARVVECRLFGGMSVAETAEALHTSTRTVERDWARARAYLHHALERGEDGAPERGP